MSHGNRKKKLNKRVTSTAHRPIESAVRFSLSLKVVQENLIGLNRCLHFKTHTVFVMLCCSKVSEI